MLGVRPAPSVADHSRLRKGDLLTGRSGLGDRERVTMFEPSSAELIKTAWLPINPRYVTGKTIKTTTQL